MSLSKEPIKINLPKTGRTQVYGLRLKNETTSHPWHQTPVINLETEDRY